MRDHSNRLRAESFGAVAFDYDRARPSYPAALIDDVLAGDAATVLDVGCGTGKVARLIAERGVAVLGVEIDERMAQVARSHGIAVETGDFGRWDAAGRRFDVIVSGQAWHWLDPDIAARKAAAVLRPGGLLAPFWNFARFDDGMRRALDAAYARTAPQLSDASVLRGGGPATVPPHAEALRDSGLFATVERRRYPWLRDYSRDEWLRLIRTHSDHSTLPAEQLAEVARAVGAAIDAAGGVLRAHYTTDAIFARMAG